MGNKAVSSFQKPRILSRNELVGIRADKAPVEIDIYELQLLELDRVTNLTSQSKNSLPKAKDCWVYFPWRNKLLHCVEASALFTLRTNRNRELITTDDQTKLAASVVGIAGMSVGSGMAVGMAYSGISQTLKIADNDTLDTSNLNRLRESILDVGRSKTDLAAERIYELDPFANVIIFDEGLNEENINSFFVEPKLNVVIDEIDDFKMKIQLRRYAHKHKIPLLMFTSLGDNILIDIERYDTDTDLKPFHGLLGDELDMILAKDTITPQDIKQLSVKLVGAEYIPTRALSSVAEMGKTLVGRPQLYSTIAVDGGLAAFVVRQIILTSQPASGRYFVKFGELFNLSDKDFAFSTDREAILKKLMG